MTAVPLFCHNTLFIHNKISCRTQRYTPAAISFWSQQWENQEGMLHELDDKQEKWDLWVFFLFHFSFFFKWRYNLPELEMQITQL